MTPTIKLIIGVVLLLVGLWVVWDGYSTSDTLAMILGAASILGGAIFIGTARRTTTRTIT